MNIHCSKCHAIHDSCALCAGELVSTESVSGVWLWGKLMDWCKSQGIAPATQDPLFSIVSEAHRINAKYANDVVSEYIAARDAYEAAIKPSGGFGQPKRLCNSDPVILRYRNARTALTAIGGAK